MRKIFLIILIVLLASQAWSATYYVKNGGNDSLDGLSDSTAWATIAKVSATVISGDTVYFRSQDTWSASSMPMLDAVAGVYKTGSGIHITFNFNSKGSCVAMKILGFSLVV